MGSSFPYIEFYPQPGQARIVQIDLDPTRIGAALPGRGRAWSATADERCEALLPQLRRHDDRAFLAKAQDGMKDWWALMDERASRNDVPMKPQVVARGRERGAARTMPMVVSDSGTITTWFARHIKARGGQLYSLSGNLATMACGLPYAIGAQVAFPDRQVVAFVGDGGFSMLMADLATAVKYELPIKVVVIKNDYLGQIKWEQMVFLGNPEYGVELQPIDFAKFAEACGGDAGSRSRIPKRCREQLAVGAQRARSGAGRGRGRPVRGADAGQGHLRAGRELRQVARPWRARPGGDRRHGRQGTHPRDGLSPVGADPLTAIAVMSLLVALGCAALIVLDMLGAGYRQPMAVMAVVWPVTALYLGPIGLWAYWRWGRPRSERWQALHGEAPRRGLATSVAVAASHCGAGCTLGDIVGASLVFLAGVEILGLALWAELAADFALAYTLGIAFQYLTIAPMRGLGLRQGLVAALRADTLSLVAFEVGMFGWMVLLRLAVFAGAPLQPNEPAYWLMMQVGMILGLLTAYPANWWLVTRGLKERM